MDGELPDTPGPDEARGLGGPLGVQIARFLSRMETLQDKQASIQDQQLATHHLHVRTLTAELANLRIEYVGKRARLLLELALAGTVLLAIFAMAFGIVQAWRSNAVVVSAMDVPPAMEAQGLNGRVVANALIDRLRALQAATKARLAQRAVSDAWSGDIQLEVPEAHITVGDLRRALHDFLSSDTSIAGSVTKTGDTINLTVRGDDFLARSFAGPEASLPSLLTQAAEYVYGQAEPLDFTWYLINTGRNDDALAVINAAPRSVQHDMRGLHALAVMIRDPGQATALIRQVVRDDPTNFTAYPSLMFILSHTGQEQAAAGVARDFFRMEDTDPWSANRGYGSNFFFADYQLSNFFAAEQDAVSDLAQHGAGGSFLVDTEVHEAEAAVAMHDWHAAEAALAAPRRSTFPGNQGKSLRVAATIARERGRLGDAAALLRQNMALAAQSPINKLFSSLGDEGACELALIEELSGNAAAADEAMTHAANTVECGRMKAAIAEHRGQWDAAQGAYAATVALAPSLPAAYQSWGEALLRQHNEAAATAQCGQAAQRAPGWADAQKCLGDAMAAQGRWQDAAKYYATAAQLTAGWGELDLRWGQALDALGQHDDAQLRYRAAQEHEVPDALNAELSGLIKR